MKKITINELMLGQLLGYLRSIEAPELVTEIADDIQQILSPKAKRTMPRTAAAQQEQEEDPRIEEEDDSSEKEDAPAGDKYERFKKLSKQMSPSDQSNALDVDLPTIYQYRARWKKEMQAQAEQED